MKYLLLLISVSLINSCAWDSEQGMHIPYDEQEEQVENLEPFQCFGENEFGKFVKGGGCNAFGCWIEGGHCNEFGCNVTGPCSNEGCSKKTSSIRCVPKN